MHRPFQFFVTYFSIGIIAAAYREKISIIATVVIILALIVSLTIVQNKNNRRKVLSGILIFVIGICYCNFRVLASKGTIAEFTGSQQIVIGTVNDTPTIKGDRAIYNVKVSSVLQNRKYIPASGKIRLSTIINQDKSIYNYGDIIKFSGNLKLPQQKRNPNGIDYRAYLLQKGIGAKMFSDKVEKISEARKNPFMAAAFSLRQHLTAFYSLHLPEDISPIMTGITLGIKDEIPKDTMKAVKNVGAAHILAVSGLHAGIVYGALEFLTYKLKLPPVISFMSKTGALIFYSAMAGLSPSAVRAAIMIITLMFSKLVGRKNDSINTLCLSATVLLIINPLNLFSISFQLSYAAVSGIVVLFEKLKALFDKIPAFLKDPLAVMISAQLAVAPFAVYYFNSISLTGSIANLLVVPLASAALITGLVSGITGLLFPAVGAFFIKVPYVLLKLIEKIVMTASKFPFASVIISTPSPLIIALYFLLLLLLFDILQIAGISEKNNVKWKKPIALILFVIIAIFSAGPFKSFEVTFVDVGQGDCILIKTRGNKTILIDGGGAPPYYEGDFDTGEDIVIPFLYSKGIKEIDLVIFSHFDDDHAKGLLSVLDSMNVGAIMYGVPEDVDIYNEMIEIARKRGIKTLKVQRGDRFSVDGAHFKVLNPDPLAQGSQSSNENSVVLKMKYNDISFLFTGDLEYQVERELVASRLDIKADVLKVGHHGSRSSTSKEFLEKVQPTCAVISVGEDNNFGHPTPEVLNRLDENNVRIFRTDISGAIIFKISGQNVKIYKTINEGPKFL